MEIFLCRCLFFPIPNVLFLYHTKTELFVFKMYISYFFANTKNIPSMTGVYKQKIFFETFLTYSECLKFVYLSHD